MLSFLARFYNVMCSKPWECHRWRPRSFRMVWCDVRLHVRPTGGSSVISVRGDGNHCWGCLCVCRILQRQNIKPQQRWCASPPLMLFIGLFIRRTHTVSVVCAASRMSSVHVCLHMCDCLLIFWSAWWMSMLPTSVCVCFCLCALVQQRSGMNLLKLQSGK